MEILTFQEFGPGVFLRVVPETFNLAFRTGLPVLRFPSFPGCIPPRKGGETFGRLWVSTDAGDSPDASAENASPLEFAKNATRFCTSSHIVRNMSGIKTKEKGHARIA